MGLVRLVSSSVQVLLVLALGSGCLTTSVSMDPPVQSLEARTESGEFKEDFVGSRGLVKKGTTTFSFNGFFADGKRVDELTLYHLAGDEARRDEIIAYRSESNTAALAGWGGSALGVGLVAAGGVMLALGREDPEFLVSQQGQISLGLLSGGGLVLAGAPIAAFTVLAPKRSLYPEGNNYGVSEELVFPLSEAMDAVLLFNTQRNGTAPASSDEVTSPAETPPETPPETPTDG